MCFKRAQTGFSLFELILLIVVFAIGLTGILVIFNQTVVGSVDPAMRKQSMAIAESMMEEILLMSYAVGPGTGGRATFDDVRDYGGFAMNGGIVDISGNPIAGLGNYSLSVAVASNATVGGVANSLMVTVTVTAPNPQASYVLVGYKTNYN